MGVDTGSMDDGFPQDLFLCLYFIHYTNNIKNKKIIFFL